MICSFIHANVSQTFKITIHPGNVVGERGNTGEDFWVLFVAPSGGGCVISSESLQDYFVPLPPAPFFCCISLDGEHVAGQELFLLKCLRSA